MDKIKNWLEMALGAVGGFIFLFFIFALSFVPLWILDFPFWLDCILIFVMTSVPLLNIVVNLGVWIWAFAVAINGPQDALAILFYIAFTINALNVFSKIMKAFRG